MNQHDRNDVYFLIVPVPEIPTAFAATDDDFQAKYGFKKPAKTELSDVVITCRSGRRVGLALEELQKMGLRGFR